MRGSECDAIRGNHVGLRRRFVILKGTVRRRRVRRNGVALARTFSPSPRDDAQAKPGFSRARSAALRPDGMCQIARRIHIRQHAAVVGFQPLHRARLQQSARADVAVETA